MIVAGLFGSLLASLIARAGFVVAGVRVHTTALPSTWLALSLPVVGGNRRHGALRLGLGLIAIVLVSASLTEVGQASSKVNAGAATQRCAHGRSVGSRITGSDYAFVRRFLPCVVKQLRSQLGFRMTVNTKVSAAAARALSVFARSPDRDVNGTIKAQAQSLLRRFCRAGGFYADNVGDTTPPPVLTPKVVGSALAKYLFGQYLTRVEHRSTVFGFAYRRGDLFHDGPARGKISLFVYALYCPSPLR